MPRVRFSRAIRELDARIRGRLIVRTLAALEHDVSGAFVFAGWIIVYLCEDDVLTIGMEDEFV